MGHGTDTVCGLGLRVAAKFHVDGCNIRKHMRGGRSTCKVDTISEQGAVGLVFRARHVLQFVAHDAVPIGGARSVVGLWIRVERRGWTEAKHDELAAEFRHFYNHYSTERSAAINVDPPHHHTTYLVYLNSKHRLQ